VALVAAVAHASDHQAWLQGTALADAIGRIGKITPGTGIATFINPTPRSPRAIVRPSISRRPRTAKASSCSTNGRISGESMPGSSHLSAWRRNGSTPARQRFGNRLLAASKKQARFNADESRCTQMGTG